MDAPGDGEKLGGVGRWRRVKESATLLVTREDSIEEDRVKIAGTAIAMHREVMARLAPAFAPRRPTETVLYGVVRSSFERFLAHTRETYEKPLPRYVGKEFRS